MYRHASIHPCRARLGDEHGMSDRSSGPRLDSCIFHSGCISSSDGDACALESLCRLSRYESLARLWLL